MYIVMYVIEFLCNKILPIKKNINKRVVEISGMKMCYIIYRHSKNGAYCVNYYKFSKQNNIIVRFVNY